MNPKVKSQRRKNIRYRIRLSPHDLHADFSLRPGQRELPAVPPQGSEDGRNGPQRKLLSIRRARARFPELVGRDGRQVRARNRSRRAVRGSDARLQLAAPDQKRGRCKSTGGDDANGQTLAAASSKDKTIAAQKVNKVEKSKMVGEAIARKAVDLGINDVTFDRGGYLYHGRVKSVAEGARAGGLKF